MINYSMTGYRIDLEVIKFKVFNAVILTVIGVYSSNLVSKNKNIELNRIKLIGHY